MWRGWRCSVLCDGCLAWLLGMGCCAYWLAAADSNKQMAMDAAKSKTGDSRRFSGSMPLSLIVGQVRLRHSFFRTPPRVAFFCEWLMPYRLGAVLLLGSRRASPELHHFVLCSIAEPDQDGLAPSCCQHQHGWCGHCRRPWHRQICHGSGPAQVSRPLVSLPFACCLRLGHTEAVPSRSATSATQSASHSTLLVTAVPSHAPPSCTRGGSRPTHRVV